MIKNKFLLAFVILSSNSLYLESSNLVIKNAEIYDGIENNPYQGHILINDGVITKISKTSVPYADKVYDAKGKIITPGFIAPDTQLGIVEIGALNVTRDDEGQQLLPACQASQLPRAAAGRPTALCLPCTGWIVIHAVGQQAVADGSFLIRTGLGKSVPILQLYGT